MAEDNVRGAMVGKMVHKVVTDQFTALRDGDRDKAVRYLQDARALRVPDEEAASTLLALSQLVVVHGFWSSQSTASPGAHASAAQLSPSVHASPSSQEPSAGM